MAISDTAIEIRVLPGVHVGGGPVAVPSLPSARLQG